MKKFVFTLLVATTLLASSCSKDKTEVPDPLKVTRITCTKNGSLSNGFSMNIIYDTDARVSSITYSNGVTDNFEYRDRDIYVLNTNRVDFTYTVSGDKITAYTVREINPYDSNERYVYDKFLYEYSGNYWKYTKMEGQRPINGSLKDYTSYVDHEFKWDGRNLTEYKAGNNIMSFEYNNDEHPTNYPFRILNNLALENGELGGTFIQKENFSPMNLMMGNNSRYLVEKARWYKNPNIDIYLAEYEFDYSTNANGYITMVTIDERINDNNGYEKESNKYVITLEYDYNPNKNK